MLMTPDDGSDWLLTARIVRAHPHDVCNCHASAQAKAKAMSYTNYFADALIAEAERDNRVIAVHAAMAGGTGLTR